MKSNAANAARGGKGKREIETALGAMEHIVTHVGVLIAGSAG
jgi:hypothetical protein